jgi:acetolactate synthase-1/2/3 large subunit
MQTDMHGAESLVRTLVAGGATTCFANPGTSEMHFVAALDKVEGMRCVLCLFEGVATGAADGWARMTGQPGLTLLHLGPGLANGLANLHNARKALSPIINIVGEHTTQHLSYDAPLTCDTEGVARPMSHWVRTGRSSKEVAAEGAAAIEAARCPPGQVATLILPADTAWGEGAAVVATPAAPQPRRVGDEAVKAAINALRRGSRTLILVGHGAVRHDNLVLAAAIAARTGARLLGERIAPRIERGGGRVDLQRIPYAVDEALAALADVETIILIGAADPVSFFGYPGRPSRMAPADAAIVRLAAPSDDIADVLARLAAAVGADPADAPLVPASADHDLPQGGLTVEKAMRVVRALLPENAIVVEESVSNTGLTIDGLTDAAPHDLLPLTGGSIGIGPPLALGAAIACPGRKVVNLQADGSAMYTLQALWSQAREGADVITIIWANGSYQILVGELAKVGAGNPGRKALDMLSLRQPALDWVKLAQGMGVQAASADTAEEFARLLRMAFDGSGPYLIEARI